MRHVTSSTSPALRGAATSAASHRMATTIPDARRVEIPDAGHSPQFENPDAWWGAVHDFLDEVRPRLA